MVLLLFKKLLHLSLIPHRRLDLLSHDLLLGVRVSLKVLGGEHAALSVMDSNLLELLGEGLHGAHLVSTTHIHGLPLARVIVVAIFGCLALSDLGLQPLVLVLVELLVQKGHPIDSVSRLPFLFYLLIGGNTLLNHIVITVVNALLFLSLKLLLGA